MTQWTIAGNLDVRPIVESHHLLAPSVVKAFDAMGPAAVAQCGATEIDSNLADTAAFCTQYNVPQEASANCVVIAGKRGDTVRYAACVVLATTRADVNGMVKKYLDARKASFAAMDDAVNLTGMEYGGITPIGLPSEWALLIDERVAAAKELVIGSGIRGGKILAPGAVLAALPNAEVLVDLAR